MIRRTLRRPPARRRGAILLVVLGMLALFAVVGLSFVLYAESEATGARNNRAARNELADPDPAAAANGFLTQILFGSSDTTSALYGIDLARSRFGPISGQSPYTGSGVPSEALTLNGLDSSGAAVAGLTLDRTQAVNFRFRAGWQQVSPDFLSDNVTRINKAVPWTYPDRNNFYLAYYDPITDTVTVPSFHRPDLFGSLDPSNPKWRNNGASGGGDSTGYWQTLRPRQGEHPLFPTVPANADGTFTGDVPNLKFLTGNQRNDSLWMDPNLPMKTWRGKQYKALIAPLVLDLSGRINLAVAGNSKGIGGVHGSNAGWGQWEQNPTGLLNFPANNTNNPLDATAQSQLQAMLNLRNNTANPPPTGLNRYALTSAGKLNGGFVPPQFSLIDASGTGSGAADAMALPAPNGFSPFPNFPAGRFATTQAGLTAQLAAVHGQSFNPLQWARLQNPSAAANNGKAYVPSLEDQLRLILRSGGPKGNPGYAGQFQPSNKLTTLFSVSQRWGEVTVLTNNAGGTAKVAAIDLTRPLPDFRKNPLVPCSPLNNWNPMLAAEFQQFQDARVARQNLARDIFVRLVAVIFSNPFNGTSIDGTTVAYNPATGYLQAFNAGMGVYGPITDPTAIANLRPWAQYAANMVDQIDSDDINTVFVWNPADATRLDVNDSSLVPNQPNFAAATIGNSTVYGVELPKLVLNEAFCSLENDRADPQMVMMVQKATKNFQKRFWIELHNPLSADPTQPDGGAVRLRYDPMSTQVPDNTGAMQAAPFAGAVYQIEIAEVPAPAMGVAQPYSTYLGANPLGLVNDNVANPITMPAALPMKIVLNDYTPYNPRPMGGAIAPATDTTNVVSPVLPAAGTNGYFLIGAQDLFPSNPQVNNSLCVNDPPAMPMAGVPVNALSYDAGVNDLTMNTADKSSSVILLRRLVNPYLPAQPDPTMANYNPYMTVDYLENVPTRDRAQYDTNGMRMPANKDAGTVGRKHPYAAAPCYGATVVAPATAAVVDQSPMPAIMNNPPHTFLASNSNLDNAVGLAWLAHLDREPVNQLELLMTGVQSPAQLTQKFHDGANYQRHATFAANGVPVPLDPAFPNFAQALDLLGVSSRLPGIPLGGRQPGLVNPNAIGDPAVLNAVLDPQSGNTFAQTAGYVANAWNNAGVGLLPSRTTANSPYGGTNNQPAATAFEVTGPGPAFGTDRPFQPTGTFFADTLFRQGATPNLPTLFNTGAGTNGHPYMQSEPLRKGWNSFTPVSDGFLVVFTVGFFEVNGTGQLGKELFDKVPGDLRSQYAGIADRSALTIDPAPNPVPPAGQFVLGPKPWETKLAADANPLSAAPFSTQITIQAQCTAAGSCTVYDDGAPVVLAAPATTGVADNGPLLRIGYAGGAAGGDGEWVRVDTITPGPTAGTAVITINTTPSAVATNVQYSTALQRFHGGGSRVSNAAVGHPGPQPLFDYREPTGKYRGVLPFIMKMVP